MFRSIPTILAVVLAGAVGLTLTPSCTGPDAERPWATPVPLDGPINETLTAVAEESGVPAPALFALAYFQSGLEPTGIFGDETLDEGPFAEDPEPELDVDWSDEPDAEASPDYDPVPGLEDPQYEAHADPANQAFVREAPGTAAVEGAMPPESAAFDPEELAASTGALSGIFRLTGEQVSWAASALGVDEGTIAEDLEVNTEAAALLLTALATADGTPIADVSHARWLDAMVRVAGSDPDEESGAFAEAELDVLLHEGFDTTTVDGEQVWMTPGGDSLLGPAEGALTEAEGVARSELQSSYPAFDERRAAAGHFTPGRGDVTVQHLVIGHFDGTLASAIRYFQGAGRAGSYHYLVGRSGRVIRMVSENDTAHTTGQGAVDAASITIGLERDPGGRYSAGVYRSAAELVAAIALQRHLSLSPADFRAHVHGVGNIGPMGALVPDAMSANPRGRFDWVLFGFLAGRYANGNPPPVTTPRPNTRPLPAIADHWSGQRVVVDTDCYGSVYNCRPAGEHPCAPRLCNVDEPLPAERSSLSHATDWFLRPDGDLTLYDGLGNPRGPIAAQADGVRIHINLGVRKSMRRPGIDTDPVSFVYAFDVPLVGAPPGRACGSRPPATRNSSGWVLESSVIDDRGILAAMPTAALRHATGDYAQYVIEAVNLSTYGEGDAEPLKTSPNFTCQTTGDTGRNGLDYLPYVERPAMGMTAAAIAQVNLISTVPGREMGGYSVDTVPVGTSFHRATSVAPIVVPLYPARSRRVERSLHFVYGFVFDGVQRRYGWIPGEAIGMDFSPGLRVERTLRDEELAMLGAPIAGATPRVRGFAVTAGHALVEASRIWDEGTFRDLSRVGTVGDIVGYPAAVRAGERLIVAARRQSGAIYVARRAGSGAWTDASPPPGLAARGTPFLHVGPRDRVEIFVRGSEGHLWTSAEDEAGVFGAWVDLGGDLSTMPTAAADHAGLHVFAIGTAGQVVTRVRDGAGAWGAWSYLLAQGNVPVAPVFFSVTVEDVRMELLGVATRDEVGRLVTQISSPDGGWRASATRTRFPDSGTAMSALLPVRRPGALRFYALGRGGRLAQYTLSITCSPACTMTKAARSELPGAGAAFPGSTTGSWAAASLGFDGLQLFEVRRVGTRRYLHAARVTGSAADRWRRVGPSSVGAF